jgi:hypothetical protein
VYKETLGYMNIGFTSMFTVECILKIVAFGVRVRNTLTLQQQHHNTLVAVLKEIQ